VSEHSSSSHRAGLATWPAEIDPVDLATWFTLSIDQIRWALEFRQPGTSVQSAIAWCALDAFGFIPALGDAPVAVVDFVADQLDFNETIVLKDLSARQDQRIRSAAISASDWVRCGKGEWKRIADWLDQRAREHDNPDILFHHCLSYLRSEQIVRPSLDRIDRAIADARNRTITAIYHDLAFDRPTEQMLDHSLRTDPKRNVAPLVWLTSGATSFTSKAIKAEADKLEYLRANRVDVLDLTAIGRDRRRQHALVAKKATPAALDRMPAERRYPIVAAALTETYVDVIDELVLMFDQAMGSIDNQARRDLTDRLGQRSEVIGQRLYLLDDIIDLVLDNNLSDAELGEKLRGIGAPRLTGLRRPETERIRNERLTLLEQRYAKTRMFSRDVLEAIEFEASIDGSDTLEAVNHLRHLNQTNKRHLNADAPDECVPTNWQTAVAHAAATDPTAHRHYWELAVLFALRNGLRSGEIWVKSSRRYANPVTHLIPSHRWEPNRAEHLDITGLQPTFSDQSALLAGETGGLLDQLEHALNDRHSNIAITNAGELRQGRLPAETVDPENDALGDHLASQLPRVPLADLLIEADHHTNFTRHLTHASGATPRSNPIEHRRNLYAAVIAQACNFGIARMAEISGISADTLAWTTRWYLREETLRAANNAIINAHHAHPLAKIWGGGTLSSSDGLRLPIRGKSLTARALSRYFVDQGGTSYTHVSDQHTTYGTQMIVTTDRDATYVLDEIIGNTSDLNIEEHTTDTHGQTLLTFALFDLVGLRLSPRIAKSTRHRLFRTERIDQYQNWPTAQRLLRHKANTTIIDQHWDDLLRIGLSIRSGHVTASLLTQRLQAGARTHPLAKALIEYGKILRTQHLLRWFTDPALRRRIDPPRV